MDQYHHVRTPKSFAMYPAVEVRRKITGTQFAFLTTLIDGTIRKDPKVWSTWHPAFGLELHPLQVRIAKRGIALLQVGAIMTYSTCSLHPIENEAVVAALLATKAVELVETKVDACITRPGWSTWPVLDDDLQTIDRRDARYPSTIHPPTNPDIQDQLHQCLRLFPPDNDTGGFFIAVLRKIKPLPPGKGRARRRRRLVTPNQTHKLFIVGEGISRSSSHCNFFQTSPEIRKHVLEEPGSAKLTVVSVGW